jgi:hypothetical protein
MQTDNNVISKSYPIDGRTQFIAPERVGPAQDQISQRRVDSGLFVGRYSAINGVQWFQVSFPEEFHRDNLTAFMEGRLEAIKLLFTCNHAYKRRGIEGVRLRAVYPVLARGKHHRFEVTQIGSVVHDLLPEANRVEALPMAVQFTTDQRRLGGYGSFSPNMFVRVETRLP